MRTKINLKMNRTVILWFCLFVIATIITFILIRQRHGAFMADVLTWTRHNNDANEVGVKGHFERLASQLMWRFVFHAGAIGWCIATAIAYWFATQSSQRNNVSVVNDVLARAFARNPLAFVSETVNITSNTAGIQTLRTAAQELLVRPRSGVNGSQVKVINNAGWQKHPLIWLRSGGAQRWIAFVGIAGFILQFLFYVIFIRPTV